jgi:PAS domain S-box-containing protein
MMAKNREMDDMKKRNRSATRDHRISIRQWLDVLDELNIGAMTVDRRYRIQAINHCAQALIGMRLNEVVQCDCREVFTGVPCMGTCVVESKGRDGYADATVHFFDEEECEYTVTRIATPIFDDNHQVAGCLTILQDHSPISDLIDRLRYEERRLKNILDSLDVAVFTINCGGLITFFNTTAEKISGYERDEVLGKPCAAIFESDASQDVCLLQDAVADGRSRSVHQGHLIGKFGESVPIRADYMALRDEKGAIIGGLATFQDMTLVHQLNQAIRKCFTFHDMIGKSPPMQRLFDMIPMVADSPATVLIEGSTGTGKDLLARIIHSSSPRKNKPWVKINCAAMPENLLESELFGYARGAFTGAERNKPGRFQEADGGTIFLDEIGDLPLALQAKLLRVLEDKEFYPLGSRKIQKVDVRIISATNQDLNHMVNRGKFREDLFYRLNVVRMELPPLTERRDDLPLLIHHVLRKLSAARALPPPIISEKAMQILLNYPYPGNVREMENILEHALILCRNAPIEDHHLPDYLYQSFRRGPRKNSTDEPADSGRKEREAIAAALKMHKGHRGKAARELGMDRTTLWRKIKRLGIDGHPKSANASASRNDKSAGKEKGSRTLKA